jgi:16S rRNA (guanine527-N7)-methyltransferase
MNPLWIDLASRAGVTLEPGQLEALTRYLDLLLAANERMNLTRITDRAAAEVQHVADALTLLPYLPRGPFTLADVGSGGGVPGIPLAVARPDARVTLIESTRKKASFLSEIVPQIRGSSLLILPLRAEQAGRDPAHREAFDVVAARAVGTLNWLAEWCLPLTRVGGKVLAMKGPKVREEIPVAEKAIKLLGGSDPIIHSVDLPGAEHHVIVEINKVRPTDRKFPRDPTTTRGKPLG